MRGKASPLLHLLTWRARTTCCHQFHRFHFHVLFCPNSTKPILYLLLVYFCILVNGCFINAVTFKARAFSQSITFSYFVPAPLFFPVVLIHVLLRCLAFASMWACYIGISILNFNALSERALFQAALWLNLPFTWIAVYVNYFFTASRLYKLERRTNSRSHVECSFQRLYTRHQIAFYGEAGFVHTQATQFCCRGQAVFFCC